MKLNHLKGLLLILVISIGIWGCGEKSATIAGPDTVKISAFTNALKTINVDYGVSYVLASQLIQEAIQAGQTPAAEQLRENIPSYDAAKEYLINYANFTQTITNAENAANKINSIDSDFQYFYVNCKNLPPSFKDDFYNMKNLVNNNLTFIQSLKEGEIDKDSLQNWMDSTAKIEKSYQSINLELERIQTK